MIAGFVAVVLCLLVLTILVFVCRGIIERIHHQSSQTGIGPPEDGEESKDRDDAG
jgi:Na+-transporting methylmalonyl-CoA/oxaloacetate decarboxylase gamma subunit